MCTLKESHTTRLKHSTFTANKQIEEVYGENSVFKSRVNSSLVEVYTALGTLHKNKAYDSAMENVEIAIKQYGEHSVFCLSYFMSGMSANVQRGTHAIAENILGKMLRVLEHSGEITNGNQYFFLASVLLGVVCCHANQFEQAHLFFTGTMKKQLKYVGDEPDHPFLEQTYMHMAVMYKNIQNLASGKFSSNSCDIATIMFKNLLAIHKRVYGESSYTLAADYKNIGTCQIGIGQANESIEPLVNAEKYSKIALSELDDESEVKDEQKQLCEIYFSQYLAYVSLNQWDKALKANNESLKLNIQILGENDLNTANNYYLGAQIYFKKLAIEDAMDYASKANAIIDSKPLKEPLLLVRYRFLRAKLYKLKENNIEALKDLNTALVVC